MALSRLAAQFAAEIRQHDWSDAPYRSDRAGHRREDDSPSKLAKQLDADETNRIRLNATWVTAQVLAYNDPNFDVYEFAAACGVQDRTRHGRLGAGIAAGLRGVPGNYSEPGTR
jgi:hypothetical protein